MTYLSNRISDYYYISQGKTRIPGVNDGEEFQITDVSADPRVFNNLILCFKYIIFSYAIRHILQANIMRSIGFQRGKIVYYLKPYIIYYKKVFILHFGYILCLFLVTLFYFI
uniref:Uncharacterized protein n=1 Tax=Schizaphis graminum TaxID=13262 RepID=A0A2S2PBL2_SCHGA